MDLILTRHSYAPTETMGVMELPDGSRLHTIERPFIADAEHGTKPFKSCVPDGVYSLVPYDSVRFGPTWALHNPDLRVWVHDRERKGGGRYSVLFHRANWAAQLAGCIAPGLGREILPYKGRHALAVIRSQKAMMRLHDALNYGEEYRLVIRCTKGAALWE